MGRVGPWWDNGGDSGDSETLVGALVGTAGTMVGTVGQWDRGGTVVGTVGRWLGQWCGDSGTVLGTVGTVGQWWGTVVVGTVVRAVVKTVVA
eukprot:7401681-Pyramimonas_sp.AAC.1